MKVYVDEMPKICAECECLNCIGKGCYCAILKEFIHPEFIWTEKNIKCPLQQLPTDSKWDKLKEYLKDATVLYGRMSSTRRALFLNDMISPILNKMQELEKGESDE